MTVCPAYQLHLVGVCSCPKPRPLSFTGMLETFVYILRRFCPTLYISIHLACLHPLTRQKSWSHILLGWDFGRFASSGAAVSARFTLRMQTRRICFCRQCCTMSPTVTWWLDASESSGALGTFQDHGRLLCNFDLQSLPAFLGATRCVAIQ